MERICSICGTKVKYKGYLGSEEFLKKYKGWGGTVLNRNGKLYDFWYCPEHSLEEENEFEHQTMHKLGIE